MKDGSAQPPRLPMMDEPMTKFSAPYPRLINAYVLRIILLQNHWSYSVTATPNRMWMHLKLERIKEALRFQSEPVRASLDTIFCNSEEGA